MQRLFFESSSKSDNQIIIADKKALHHTKDVLRLKAGDKVIAVDEKGNQYRCMIEKLTDKMTLVIEEIQPASKRKKAVEITLACAIPKKAKMDEVIDKVTQLGVERIIPLETQRVIVKLNEEKKRLRQGRWQKIAQSASQQSQRNTIPLIEPISKFKAVLARAENFDLKLIPTLFGRRLSLRQVISRSEDHGLASNSQSHRTKPKNILIFIGPEGDFSEEEVDLAKNAGCIPVSLGESVLRVDTACITVVSFVRLYYAND